jgi:hypothetical protein
LHCPETDSDCSNPDCTIKICLRHQQEILSGQRIAEWELDFRSDPTNREAAALQVLRDLLSLHNAQIAANEPGRFKWDNGDIVDTPLSFPDGHGSKQLRQRLVEQILESKKPDIIERVGNAIDKIVAAEKPRFSQRNEQEEASRYSTTRKRRPSVKFDLLGNVKK